MLSKLFIPIKRKINVYQYLIGYQRLIVFDYLDFKDDIIVDKIIKKIIVNCNNIYLFSSFEEMEKEFDLVITCTNEDYIVIIS